MSYRVHEIFYTLQGEGAQAGRAAVFCRFSGCNLWSGREEDRAKAICTFCDTVFVGPPGEQGGDYADASALAGAIARTWRGRGGTPYVVMTGGEPLLQLDAALIEALHAAGFEVGVETNGSTLPPPGLDWICVSPKAGAPWRLRDGDELKLVYPQPALLPDSLPELRFTHHWVQPMDGPNRAQNTALAVAYCLSNPTWRLSTQTHKWNQIP